MPPTIIYIINLKCAMYSYGTVVARASPTVSGLTTGTWYTHFIDQ